MEESARRRGYPCNAAVRECSVSKVRRRDSHHRAVHVLQEELPDSVGVFEDKQDGIHDADDKDEQRVDHGSEDRCQDHAVRHYLRDRRTLAQYQVRASLVAPYPGSVPSIAEDESTV
eukprot:2944743-Rhodomonas_salina.3